MACYFVLEEHLPSSWVYDQEKCLPRAFGQAGGGWRNQLKTLARIAFCEIRSRRLAVRGSVVHPGFA
jgi:hypothetical protein